VRLDHLLSKDIFGTSSLEDDKRNNIDILYSVLNAHWSILLLFVH
jgi:hypothetical protein